MQNANIGLVDITLTCHFEVKDAEVFGGAGSVGYTSVALKHAKAAGRPTPFWAHKTTPRMSARSTTITQPNPKPRSSSWRWNSLPR